MRIGLGQFNAVVGDLFGNAEKMRSMYAEAVRSKVDLLIFPELAICGYPPEDLLHKKHFLEDCRVTIEKLAADCPKVAIIAGFAEQSGDDCYNSAAVLQNGKVSKIYRKVLLPNYGVFDERRYFRARGNQGRRTQYCRYHLRGCVGHRLAGRFPQGCRANPNGSKHLSFALLYGQDRTETSDSQPVRKRI
jgi:predicted amidohydrolase